MGNHCDFQQRCECFKKHNITDIEKLNNINILFETDNSLLETECRIENKYNNSNENQNSKDIISLENIDEEKHKKRRKKPRRLDRKKGNLSKEQAINRNSNTDPIVLNTSKEDTENKDSISDKNKSLSNKIITSSEENTIKKVSRVSNKKSYSSKTKILKKDNIKNMSPHKKTVSNKVFKQNGSEKDSKNNVEEENKFFNETDIKRVASSSQPLDIVDVDILKKKKKSGWWNQSKK